MSRRRLLPWNRRSKQVPVHHEEEAPLRSLQSEMNRLFEDFSRDFGLAGFDLEGVFRPEVDFEETDAEIRVRAELPGMEEKDIDVSLSGELLTLRGEKRDERSGKEHGARWTERRYGAFVRTIPIPCEVEADRIEASFRRGVLTVTLPKTTEARGRTRRIEVRAD